MLIYGVLMCGTAFETMSKLDEIDGEMVGYMTKHGRVKAGELAELVGITTPSIRVRLFQLMVKGVVGQEKTRDHNVWFFLTTGKEKEAASRANSKNGNTTIPEPENRQCQQ